MLKALAHWVLRNECCHTWGKWSKPSETVMAGSEFGMGWLAVIQERECEKCGVVQTRTLPKLRRLKSATKDR